MTTRTGTNMICTGKKADQPQSLGMYHQSTCEYEWKERTLGNPLLRYQSLALQVRFCIVCVCVIVLDIYAQKLVFKHDPFRPLCIGLAVCCVVARQMYTRMNICSIQCTFRACLPSLQVQTGEKQDEEESSSLEPQSRLPYYHFFPCSTRRAVRKERE
jgi:hypothetical protein